YALCSSLQCAIVSLSTGRAGRSRSGLSAWAPTSDWICSSLLRYPCTPRRILAEGNNCFMPALTTAIATEKARTAVIDALLAASRAMVAIASRSLADTDPDVTLPQSRALVLMASRGPQRIADVADDLGVAPSTATRMCDRLVRKQLVRRYRTAA